ncbi:MAG: outer rane transport energization protein TonB [Alphaproteobacteria bacterium]|nr:outer rane transport energization protein TonB [Alphaproteobacteria bacterium]
MHTLNGHGNTHTHHRDRVIAGAATLLLYLPLLALLLRPSTFLNPIAVTPHPAETLLELLPQPRPQVPPKPDFVTHLIRPRAVNAPMPQIVLAPQPVPAPRAPLPVTAAETSVMAGGAVQGVGAGAVSGTGTGGNGTGQSSCIDPAYLAQIVRHVGHYFHFPPDAAREGLTGIAYVRFLIDKNGRLMAQSVAISSGHRKLDDYALVLMREAAPLPPIPERMHTDQLAGLLPIHFAIEGRLAPREMMAGQSANGCN